MKVADLLETRRENWRELERACYAMDGRRLKTIGAAHVQRFAALYRAACADLALADAYQLPPNTVHYLHQLVGRAHNQLYPSRAFAIDKWSRELFHDLPQRLFRDNCLRLAFAVFWGVFLACMLSAYFSPQFAETVASKEMIDLMERMYEEAPENDNPFASTGAAGFYVWHNASIGLQCFSMGLLLGVGGLFTTVSNAAVLGTVFGHMASVPQRVNFFNFVSAHGPFELTAIVLSAAAGMRLGFSIIDTRGWTRAASLRRATREAMPAACAAVVLFCLAALIEAFVSPSSVPYPFKALVLVVTSGMLLFYFVLLGYPRGND